VTSLCNELKLRLAQQKGDVAILAIGRVRVSQDLSLDVFQL
jgi:hypothetical protein